MDNVSVVIMCDANGQTRKCSGDDINSQHQTTPIISLPIVSVEDIGFNEKVGTLDREIDPNGLWTRRTQAGTRVACNESPW